MSLLVIPIDASQIPDKERGQQSVKVAIKQGGKVYSQDVPLREGKSEVRLEVNSEQPISYAVGGGEVPDQDLFNVRTITGAVSPRQWLGKNELAVAPVIITPYWWRYWLRWCRDFTIEGKVVCADGSPVPGAEVRAYDVDFLWWWSSVIPVGPSAVTDANGNFQIKFRWCCGWWPWWWWKLRVWRLEPLLFERIDPVLKFRREFKFKGPQQEPTLEAVEQLLRAAELAEQSEAPQLSASALVSSSAARRPVQASADVSGRVTDPTVFANIRDQLVRALPHVPELEKLHVWPWYPWHPWLDCAPDVIFRVTQNCGGATTKVIVKENIFQTRWDIPTNLNVTLVANGEACCIPEEDPEPEGDCALFTSVCGYHLDQIGGNAGAPAPVGYYNPGGRDRPFSEVVNFYGQFGSSAQADFYQLEYTPHGANAWANLPPLAPQGFYRQYFDATQPWPNQWFYPGFPVISFGGQQFYESRRHYEATHPPANWGSPFGRSWTANTDLLASVQTSGNFADGAYDFRLVGYQATAGGDPDFSTRKVLDGCGGQQNNLVTLRLDNRIVGPGTPGSVHVNTTEPDCGILDVRLGASTVEPCGAEPLPKPPVITPLEIDFFATDPDGHLDHYELVVKYDLGTIKDLLDPADVGTFSLTTSGPDQEGPDYSDAVTQGAVRPKWKGGTMTLHINDASKVFPKTCCYLIELRVYKRNIVNCSGHLTYYNQMHYSFTVTV